MILTIKKLHAYSLLDLPDLSPHNLRLKVGSVVIMFRNLNQPILYNGKRLVLSKLMMINVIYAAILTGKFNGHAAIVVVGPIRSCRRDASGVVLMFRLTQVLTGHGCIGRFLFRIRWDDTPGYHHYVERIYYTQLQKFRASRGIACW